MKQFSEQEQEAFM